MAVTEVLIQAKPTAMEVAMETVVAIRTQMAMAVMEVMEAMAVMVRQTLAVYKAAIKIMAILIVLTNQRSQTSLEKIVSRR
jgi:hypothetical protein